MNTAGGSLESTSQGDGTASGRIASPQFGPISMQRKWIFSDLLCLETNCCFDNQTEWYSRGSSRLSPEVCFLSLPKLDILFMSAHVNVFTSPSVSAQAVEGQKVVSGVREAENDDGEDERGQ